MWNIHIHSYNYKNKCKIVTFTNSTLYKMIVLCGRLQERTRNQTNLFYFFKKLCLNVFLTSRTCMFLLYIFEQSGVITFHAEAVYQASHDVKRNLEDRKWKSPPATVNKTHQQYQLMGNDNKHC